MTKTIKYTKAEQEEIMKLHLQEGRSLQSLSAEYNLGKGRHLIIEIIVPR